jgi:hypothetical protein
MDAQLLRRPDQAVVIPAHPLALDPTGEVDERAQRALTRYYLAAEVDGIAVGVHTTQFALHADRGRLAAVWSMAADLVATAGRDVTLVAGVCGDVDDACAEAALAASLGYRAALLCPWGMSDGDEVALVQRARVVGEIMPTIGFYLQESVGGRRLGRAYWRQLFDLPSTVAVKAAPFDRYRTNDVAQALLCHDRWREVVLLTGNDDAIVHDLVTPYTRVVNGEPRTIRAGGGLLGQWALGTRAAVELVRRLSREVAAGGVATTSLATAADLVELNAAVFDVGHDFAGCVAGVNEALRQRGVVSTTRLLAGEGALSRGQAELIAAVGERHPYLVDRDFIAEHLDSWRR